MWNKKNNLFTEISKSYPCNMKKADKLYENTWLREKKVRTHQRSLYLQAVCKQACKSDYFYLSYQYSVNKITIFK